MISNRHRGLVELHSVATLLAVGVFFWLYANVIYYVPFVHLNRDVKLLPYFLCVVIGMLVGTRNLAALGPRLLRLDWGVSAGLALQQVVEILQADRTRVTNGGDATPVTKAHP